MKVIALWNNYKDNTLCQDYEEPALCWLSDSCLLRERKPFYIPDFDTDFQLYPTVALRIDRLGKSISEKFASRYWSEVSVWLNVRAVNKLHRLQSQGLPLAGAVAFDNSLISAPYFAITPEEFPSLKASVWLNGRMVAEWNANQLVRNPAQCIALTSNCNILKTGDVLLLGFPTDGIKVAPGDEVELHIDSPTEVFSSESNILNRFKVK